MNQKINGSNNLLLSSALDQSKEQHFGYDIVIRNECE
jgi:hypothetical protein